MSVRITEVAGVDAPGSIVYFGYWCARRFGFGQQGVDILPSCHDMAKAELTAPRRPARDAGIFGKLRARVEGENLPPGEVEHEDGASRVRVVAAVLGCYHTGRLEAERSVERECAIEVGNGEGYYINARFHQSRSSFLQPPQPVLAMADHITA